MNERISCLLSGAKRYGAMTVVDNIDAAGKRTS